MLYQALVHRKIIPRYPNKYIGYSSTRICLCVGHLGDNTASTSRVKYRSFLKAKLEVYEKKESSTKYDIEMIPADVPKGEIN